MTDAQTSAPGDILIVEDSPTQAQRLEHILVQQGYQVRRAADGRVALAAVQQHKPQMIISDVVMPEMDGYELCRCLKDDASFADVPVMLVTTLSDPEDVIRGLECRADNFILKPYDERHLIKRVQYVLLNRQMRQTEQAGLAVEIFFNGQRHTITADRLQILNLLLSTYDAAIQRNRELTRAQDAIRQAENFLSSIIENVPSTIFVKDGRDLRYVRLNRAFEELLGRPRSEVLGKTDHDLFAPEVAEFFAATDGDALERLELIDIQETPFHTAHSVRYLHTKKLPILDEEGRPQYLLGISEDITEQRASQQALASATREAERANRAKSDFISRMSHDLRTPLNAVLGFAQLLDTDALNEEQADSVRQILRGGQQLLELVNEVLDIARIEAGHLSLSPEPVCVEDIVQEVVNLVRPLSAPRRVQVSVDALGSCGLYVHADRLRLRQVLVNLVGNAVKYNRDHGSVNVSCERAAGDRIRLAVSDTGAGIPQGKLDLLFRPFERLGAEQSAVEGTGLGLALSKGLTEAMGGRIGVHSVVDRGSTFWVDLPEAGAPQPRAEGAVAAARHAPVESVQGTILYIEDNRSNVRLVERILARRPGVHLVCTPQGRAGLQHAKRDTPDLILLDLHLPDMAGDEVFRQLWSDPETRPIPVVVLSADATPDQARRLLAAGAAAYLTKPLNVRELLAVIDERLGVPPSGGGEGSRNRSMHG